MKKDRPRNEWITVKEKTIIKSPVVQVIERDCKSSEDERQHRFYLFKSNDWCNIIPITEDGKIVMVKQFRIGIDDSTLEIPGGVVDAEDHATEDAALRELAEETGYVPLPGAQCINLGWTFPNPALQNNRCHSFVIGPVRKEKAQKLDEGEMIETVEISLSELPEKIIQGQITHALMLNTFFFLTLRSPVGRDALQDMLSRFTGKKATL